MFATDCAYHCPPRAVAIPRALRASAISPQRPRASLLGLADDGENIGRVAIRLGLHGTHGILAGVVEPWVTEGDPTGLGGRKGLTGAPGDERLLLPERLNDFAGTPTL